MDGVVGWRRGAVVYIECGSIGGSGLTVGFGGW